jgi:hypothetical protein
MQIPGVDWPVAADFDRGDRRRYDMNVFPSAYNLTASAGVRPDNHESAGERARKVDRHLCETDVAATKYPTSCLEEICGPGHLGPATSLCLEFAFCAGGELSLRVRVDRDGTEVTPKKAAW